MKKFKRFMRKFLDKVGRTGFALIFCMPLILWSFYRGGWSSLAAAILGFIIGNMISKRIFKK